MEQALLELLAMLLVKFLSWIRLFDTLMHIVNNQEGGSLWNFPTLFGLLLGSIIRRLMNVPLVPYAWEIQALKNVLHN